MKPIDNRWTEVSKAARDNGRVLGPYRTFVPRRVALSLAASLLAVALALVAKAVVESLTPLTYTIHWLETVPLLVLLLAFILNGAWNQRAPP